MSPTVLSSKISEESWKQASAVSQLHWGLLIHCRWLCFWRLVSCHGLGTGLILLHRLSITVPHSVFLYIFGDKYVRRDEVSFPHDPPPVPSLMLVPSRLHPKMPNHFDFLPRFHRVSSLCTLIFICMA